MAEARQQVAVVEDADAALQVPRLLLRGARDPGPAGRVAWELCYGGVRIAGGSLDGDQEVLFADIPSIDPAMDSGGFSLTARYADGQAAAIEAICVRPARQLTRAEATARAKWSGTRDQPEAPGTGRGFLVETREVSRSVPAASGTETRRHSVCVYQHFAVLLANRRRRVRQPAPAPRADGRAPADGKAAADGGAAAVSQSQTEQVG